MSAKVAFLDKLRALEEQGARVTNQGFQYQHAFFGHLKEELFHDNSFDTVKEFTVALEEYIEWHNTVRISTTLEGLSPVEYRAQALKAIPTSRSQFRSAEWGAGGGWEGGAAAGLSRRQPSWGHRLSPGGHSPPVTACPPR